MNKGYAVMISGKILNSMDAVAKIRTNVRTNVGEKQYQGTGFFISASGHLATCYHVVYPEGSPTYQTKVIVEDSRGRCEGTVVATDCKRDLAILKVDRSSQPLNIGSWNSVQIGSEVVFVGYPTGVRVVSLFSGVVSAKGTGLLADLPKEMLQINGTVNRGNSGGPVFDLCSGEVVGVVTSKYVPFFEEVEKLQKFIKEIPQVPAGTGIQNIDFGKFVNFVTQSIELLSSTLILVQVGIGFAVPIDFLPNY